MFRDLRKMDMPTLVMHGEDEQIVPIKDAAYKSAKILKNAQEIYYPGAPHGMTATLQDKINADLLTFIKSYHRRPTRNRQLGTSYPRCHVAADLHRRGRRRPGNAAKPDRMTGIRYRQLH